MDTVIHYSDIIELINGGIGMREQFNTVIEYEGRKYRYNEAEALLEWIGYNGEELEVVDVIGLSVENAEADLMGYIAGWHMDINMELQLM